MPSEPSRLPLAMRPARASRKVDLPAPLGPRIAVTWPRSAWPEMSFSRYTSFFVFTPSFFVFFITLYDRFLNSSPCPGNLVTFTPAPGTPPPRFASVASRRLSRLSFLSVVRRGGGISPASVRWLWDVVVLRLGGIGNAASARCRSVR
uniref:Uncharacterized protein n=1 Tax=Leersia perrieri TaxID=77586 RepID=A0A0D9XDI0_9ORYZ